MAQDAVNLMDNDKVIDTILNRMNEISDRVKLETKFRSKAAKEILPPVSQGDASRGLLANYSLKNKKVIFNDEKKDITKSNNCLLQWLKESIVIRTYVMTELFHFSMTQEFLTRLIILFH